MSPTIVLISGAGRGLGKGLLERFLAKENHIVIAANRDPESPTFKALKELPAGPGSRVIVVKVDASVESDASAAIDELTSTHGIDHLDIVIANAGIAYTFPTVSQLKGEDLINHITPNVLGFVWLFQAAIPLLKRSANPKFVTMGSATGWLGIPVANAAYAPTKTLTHWMTKKISGEEDWLLAMIADPGWVQTDMGNSSARMLGLQEAPDRLDESCDGIVKVIDEAKKEIHGGKMWSYHGNEQPW
ncbi:NAD(P)-binding protein [Hypoxylon trugodes]|uniref:NAD(P)-binding protein n=1 Tax=Hypoxylon trugodes TaxID=326681 RepID=UPI0021A10A76|nr:NAD(P)-binding protein [Hypoxylon trugodes]KAI1392522.1 NAD(P)-binding protein [Hypoxylon trugodes]